MQLVCCCQSQPFTCRNKKFTHGIEENSNKKKSGDLETPIGHSAFLLWIQSTRQKFSWKFLLPFALNIFSTCCCWILSSQLAYGSKAGVWAETPHTVPSCSEPKQDSHPGVWMHPSRFPFPCHPHQAAASQQCRYVCSMCHCSTNLSAALAGAGSGLGSHMSLSGSSDTNTTPGFPLLFPSIPWSKAQE